MKLQIACVVILLFTIIMTVYCLMTGRWFLGTINAVMVVVNLTSLVLLWGKD